MDSNGNATWTRWVLGLLVSIGIFFGGYAAGGQGDQFEKRITMLENQASKGQRWTLEQQMAYMDQENIEDRLVAEELADIRAKLNMICRATNAGC